MSASDASRPTSFPVRTLGRLLGGGKRTVTVGPDGLRFEPGGALPWSDFRAYRGELPHTLLHRDGRRLTLAQASNGARGLAGLTDCLKAVADAIATYNAGRPPEAQLRPDLDGEWRAARTQRLGMAGVIALALALLATLLASPAPTPVVLAMLLLGLVFIGVAHIARLTRRMRVLDARRVG